MAFDGFNVDTAAFGQAIRRLSSLSGKTQAENLVSAARSTLSNRRGSGLLQITPPGTAGAVGAAAKQIGEAAIRRDMFAIFTPVKLKNKRREEWPDPEAIHLRLFIGKHPGHKLRSDRGRSFYHVDRRKFNALLKKLLSHVGRLASGWLPAAQSLGVAAAAWVSRHGSGRGDVKVKLTGPKYLIEMICDAPPNSPIDELERRVQYALDYEQAALERDIDFKLQLAAQKAGFKVV